MTFEEICARMTAEYEKLAGFRPDDASDAGIRIKVLAGEVFTALCMAESLRADCFPQTAAGEALDMHAAEHGLARKAAVKAEGELKFSRASALSYAVEIPKGTVCAADGSEAVEYETTERAVLPAGETQVYAAAQAVAGGKAGNAAVGRINTLVTPPAGVETVTNEKVFTGGADAEGDEALRERLFECFYALPNGSNTETYRRAALEIPGVKSVQVVPRANGVNTVTVYLYGDGAPVSDACQQEVRRVLSELKEISVDVTVTAAQSVKKSVTLYVRPAENCSFLQAKNACTEAVQRYIQSLHVGEAFIVARAVQAVMETGTAMNCSVPSSVTDLTPAAGQIVTAGTVNILETQV